MMLDSPIVCSLDRPKGLPKTERLKQNGGGSQNYIHSLKKRPEKRVVKVSRPVPHLDTTACERLIYEDCDSTLSGDYDSKCSFLNRLDHLISQTIPDSLHNPEFFELMCSTLIHFVKDDHPAIRAMSFRLLRVSMSSERNLVLMLTSHVDIYVVRGLDLRVENEMERSEALQLIAAMISIYESSNLKKLIESSVNEKNKKKYAFPRSIMQPVIAIALKAINSVRVKDNSGEGRDQKDNSEDRLALPCLSLFLEFCIHEPEKILEMAGTDWMVRVLTGTAAVSRRISAVVSRILVLWLDDPIVRMRGQLHLVLEQVFAPLIEFGFFQQNPASSDIGDHVVESVMENFSYSFLCILRSWSGLFACAAVGPNSTVIASSPLRLLEYLGLGTIENPNLSMIRDTVVDICCDFVNLPYASQKFTTWSEAVAFYGSATSPDQFSTSLKGDFVLAQSEFIINNDADFTNHVDLLSSFRAFAFFVLVHAGLPQSLSRLIVAQPDAPSAIKATLLMADMLRLAPSIVPSGWRAAVLSMPTLVQSACEALANGNAAAATHGYYDPHAVEHFTFVNAENAELVLHRFDVLNRVWIQNATRPSPADSPYALFLHPINQTRRPADSFQWTSTGGSSTSSLLTACFEDDLLNTKVVLLLLTELLEDVASVPQLDDIDTVVNVLGKVIEMVSPKHGVQSAWLTDRTTLLAARKALLLSMELSGELPVLKHSLQAFVNDFKSSLDTVGPATSGVFSLKNLVYGATMYQFCLVGALSTHEVGILLLEDAGIFQLFISMMNTSTSLEYVKLIVASLDYHHSSNELAMIVLQKSLTATSEASRLWCTRFLSALAGLRLSGYEDWGMRLILGQLGDQSVKVVRHAIRLLHEWFPVYPSSTRFLSAVNMETFGEAGVLLKAHFYSNEDICERDQLGVENAITLWMQTMNTRYYEVIDDDMRIALLSVQRSFNGGFSRSSGERREKYGLRVPVHLFASLAKHDFGREMLLNSRVAQRLVSLLTDDSEPPIVKGALAALGHLAGTQGGFELLPSEAVPRMIRLAEEACVLSVRGAAFWSLNILGSTIQGARCLAKLGWESNRHRWVVDEVRQGEGDGGEEEVRRATLTPMIPEISVERSQRAQTHVPASIQSRNRSSSEVFPFAMGESPVESRPTLRRSHSDATLFCNEYNGHDNEGPSPCRGERTMTGESALTSGIGSLGDDSVTSAVVLGRRRATTTSSLVDEMESRSRSSTIAYCLSQGLTADRSRMQQEATVVDSLRDPHFSSRNREKWRLAPLRLRRFLQVTRNVGDPVRYTYMMKNEEDSLSEYRRCILKDWWLWRQLHHDGETPSIASAYPVHVIALPAEVEVMCTDIFCAREEPAASVAVERVEDRGAKSGHGGRSQRTDAALAHSAYRCFYCSNNDDKYVLPPDVDVAALRRQVLYEVDMLEIKDSVPERRLISLRASHGWLFEWPCLYADVLELLDEYRFKARSRAFLQEIFYNALKL